MKDDILYLEETEEQKEALDEVMAMLGIVIGDFVEVDPENLPLEQPLTTLFQNNQEALGISLAKLHLFFDLTIEYNPYTEFNEFKTLEDIFQYLGEKVLTKRSLW